MRWSRLIVDGSASQRVKKSAGRFENREVKSPPPKRPLRPREPIWWQARQPRVRRSFWPSSADGWGFSSPFLFLVDFDSDYFFSSSFVIFVSFCSGFFGSVVSGDS